MSHLIDRFLDVPGGVTATFRIISFKLCLNNLRILCYESLLDWPNRIESSMHILNLRGHDITDTILEGYERQRSSQMNPENYWKLRFTCQSMVSSTVYEGKESDCIFRAYCARLTVRKSNLWLQVPFVSCWRRNW